MGGRTSELMGEGGGGGWTGGDPLTVELKKNGGGLEGLQVWRLEGGGAAGVVRHDHPPSCDASCPSIFLSEAEAAPIVRYLPHANLPTGSIHGALRCVQGYDG